MHKVKQMKTEVLFPVLKELLTRGLRATITVTGMSMYPFLRDSIDRVELSNVSFSGIHCGDIVLIKRDDGQYVLHRVWKKELEHFYIVGDAQQCVEGPLRPDQLIAVTVSIWRNNRQVSCSDFWWRLLSFLWRKLFRHRYFIIRAYRKLRKLIT